MIENDPLCVAVLKTYPKAIVCMRQAKRHSKFGLVFGAGVSAGFHLPDWKTLLDDIATHTDVQAQNIDKEPGLTSRAEVLYRYYFDKRRDADKFRDKEPQEKERAIKGEWFNIISTTLYANFNQAHANIEGLDEAHPYLGSYLDIILSSPLTVNYNFDSCVEMMLLAYQKRLNKPDRLYETIFDANPPFRSSKSIIYHPNGFLPRNILDGFSDDIVFSEQEFGDQLIESVAGRYSSLAHHLSKNTCLFMGVSFNDENLKYLLRQGALNNPGHYHYCLQLVPENAAVNEEYQEALAHSRFEVYNLITLFLTEPEYAALGKLLSSEYAEFQKVAVKAKVRTLWIYYLTGVQGIGKTSACRFMGSLAPYDEWLEDPPSLLGMSHSMLTSSQREEVDDWVLGQFIEKNKLLLQQKEGVFLVDRAPLDPLTFNEEYERSQKAARYSTKLSPQKLQPGHIILLLGKPKEISSRLARRKGEPWDEDKLAELQENLKQVYGNPGTNTYNWTLRQQVKALARIVYSKKEQKYQECDLQGLLFSIKNQVS